MHLSWKEQDRIAKALLTAYPEQDRLALNLEQLRQLIVALPGFQDTPQPPGDAWLNKILWTWMRMAHAEEDAVLDVFSSPCSMPADTISKRGEG
jgi:FeS assembly protein IscX